MLGVLPSLQAGCTSKIYETRRTRKRTAAHALGLSEFFANETDAAFPDIQDETARVAGVTIISTNT
jgi:hypothetical protein